MLALLRIDLCGIILARYMWHIDSNQNISLLLFQSNESQHNASELRLVRPSLLLGSWWGLAITFANVCKAITPVIYARRMASFLRACTVYA